MPIVDGDNLTAPGTNARYSPIHLSSEELAYGVQDMRQKIENIVVLGSWKEYLRGILCDEKRT